MDKTVTIVIPVYNVRPYIERCLQSVAAQTYSSIECVLVDDCGTDGSMAAAEQFIGGYEGSTAFRVVRHGQNLGLSAARNTGLGAATGEYVYFLDSDDAITPDCITTLAALAAKHPDADYVQGEMVAGGEELMKGRTEPGVPELCSEKAELENIILCKTHRTAWNRLLKRSFLTENHLLFRPGILMEDHLWTYFVAKHARAVAFARRGTYYYYNNGGSLVNSPSRESLVKRYASYIVVADEIVGDLLQRSDVQACHRVCVAEALAFCMVNLARLKSLRHWCRFWRFSCRTAWRLRSEITCRRLAFFLCLLPPLCFMMGVKGWRWRLREFIARLK